MDTFIIYIVGDKKFEQSFKLQHKLFINLLLFLNVCVEGLRDVIKTFVYKNKHVITQIYTYIRTALMENYIFLDVTRLE